MGYWDLSNDIRAENVQIWVVLRPFAPRSKVGGMGLKRSKMRHL